MVHFVLQCVAVCCSVLQCVAVFCARLNLVNAPLPALRCCLLQCVLQFMLRCVVMCRCVLRTSEFSERTAVSAMGLQVAVCVTVCVAVCCSVLQCVAVCCSVLQCVAVCCSVLQCVEHIQIQLTHRCKRCGMRIVVHKKTRFCMIKLFCMRLYFVQEYILYESIFCIRVYFV